VVLAEALTTPASGGAVQGCQASFLVLNRAEEALAAGSLVKVPAGMHVEEALLAAEELPTAIYAALAMPNPLDRADVYLPQKVATKLSPPPLRCIAVLGCDTVGCLTVLALRHFYQAAAVIIAADDTPSRRGVAKSLGADHVCSPSELKALVPKHTNGKGCDGVIDAVGRSMTVIKAALGIIADGGTLVLCAAIPPAADKDALLPMHVAFKRNLTVRYGKGPPRCSAIPTAIHFALCVQQQRHSTGGLRAVIPDGHRLSYELCEDAYKLTTPKSGGALKVVLIPDTDRYRNASDIGVTAGGGAKLLPRSSTLAASLD